YLTAPIVRPRTSLFCASQPARITGSDSSVAAADSRARNSPSDDTKPTKKIGPVPAVVAVRLTAKKNSFHEKMKQISAVAAMPGETIGNSTRRMTESTPAPSSEAASITERGTSSRNERIIHTASGRFIEQYRITRVQMLSSIPRYLTTR